MKRIVPIFKGVLVISASISIFFFHQNILVQIFYIVVLLFIIIPEVIKAYRRAK
ncbi:hypothetical protein OGZ39_06150 [Lactococcus lactis]|uniref:Uncharacterized protein n=1 Tax=Lactococcus lactis TaxID=1358 RepID=A0A9X4NC45_9LACT|nr:hypothetical protein [Lactococcus lactis]MDG4981236.1 hypothetical protein [Lactococcus lactis]